MLELKLEIFIQLCAAFYSSLLFPLAPSQISKFIKEAVQQRSIQLSWQEPRQANGAIKEYEIKYYEKVSWPQDLQVSFLSHCKSKLNEDET